MSFSVSANFSGYPCLVNRHTNAKIAKPYVDNIFNSSKESTLLWSTPFVVILSFCFPIFPLAFFAEVMGGINSAAILTGV
jgi:hypothetical protein